MAIYLEHETIDGNVTAVGFEKQIKIESFQFGVGRGITMEPGNLSNREATRPSLSEVTVGHKTDTSAVALFKEAVTGAAGKKVTIRFVQTGATSLEPYMTYTLYDTLVSGYSISAEGDSDPYETISLSYAKIEVEYNDFDSNNASGSPQRGMYDLTTGQPG